MDKSSLSAALAFRKDFRDHTWRPNPDTSSKRTQVFFAGERRAQWQGFG